MKKNIDGDKISIFLVVFIIIIALVFVLYIIFSNNIDLMNNDNNKTNQTKDYNSENNNNNNSNENINNIENTNNSNNASNSNTLSEQEKDDLNIDENEKPKEEDKAPVETDIATYTTTIYDKDENRVSNITLANSKLNGVVINPGETFSFNNTIGPMNEEQGFKKALGFDANGKKIQISGGGLCQISSTIYNAVLIANLEVVERHPHSRRVYYVPKDKDATIVYGSLDFKFKNNTDKKIKIYASNDNASVVIRLVSIS